MVSRSAKKYLGLGAIVALLLLLYYHGGSRTGQLMVYELIETSIYG
jgi:hypothetical protein